MGDDGCLDQDGGSAVGVDSVKTVVTARAAELWTGKGKDQGYSKDFSLRNRKA